MVITYSFRADRLKMGRGDPSLFGTRNMLETKLGVGLATSKILCLRSSFITDVILSDTAVLSWSLY